MNGIRYIRVCESESDSPIEVPLESDNTLLLSTLTAQFPECTGLKYKSDSGCYRGVRLSDDRLFLPTEADWQNSVFYCVFPKGTKRKADEEVDDSYSKLKRLERKICTDLIVLNLPWRADEKLLREYFSRYGEVAMVQIKRDPNTQQSRGYGFIRFADYGAQVMCLAERHSIENRICEVRIPISKIEGDRQEVSRKIHVGRLTEDITTDALRQHFSQFGKVVDVFIPKPFRSFAFVTFEDPDVATSILGKDQVIDGVVVTVGSAVPKIPMSVRQNSMQKVGMLNAGMPPSFQSPLMASQQWGAWPPAYPGMMATKGLQNGRNGQGQNGGGGGGVGLNPAAAAAAAVLAAEYTRVHHNRNSGAMGGRGPNDYSNNIPNGSLDQPNSAALATMNILSNPNVVAAIVNAATGGASGHPNGGRSS